MYERKLSIVEPLVSESNDPKMVDQWHLGASKVNEAWEYLEANSLPAGGDDSIVVAVIDTGVDYDHPDLIQNFSGPEPALDLVLVLIGPDVI